MGGAAVHYGGGRHIATLEPWQVTNVIKLTVISFVPGVTSFVAPKFAVVILLAKLLMPSRTHVICMWVMSAVYLLLTAGMLAINFAQCTPAAAQWGGAEGTCWDRRITVDYALTVGIVSVLFDFYLAIYPTIVLWRLQMNWKRKLAISSSLGFGYWQVLEPLSVIVRQRSGTDLHDSKPVPALLPFTNAPRSRASLIYRTLRTLSAPSCSGPSKHLEVYSSRAD